MDPPRSPPVKLEWMYKDTSSNVDREEYLLGRTIDKTFERSEFGGDYDLEKDGVPRSIFAAQSSSQIDLQRKIQEDPLEAIRQKEIEVRKQLLKNPIKLRKLQNMLKDQKKKKDPKKKSKKHKKKKSKSSDSSSEDEDEALDKLLAAKYSKLVKTLGKEKLSSLKSGTSEESESEDEEAPKKFKKNRNKEKKKTKHPKDSDSDDSSKKTKDKKKSRHSTSPESDREWEKKSKKRPSSTPDEPRRRRDLTPDDSRRAKSRRSRSRDRSRRDRSEERPGRRQERDSYGDKHKPFGLSVLKPSAPRDSRSYSERKEEKKPEVKEWKKPGKSKLSEDEIERRRREMMDNAKWRDDFRQKNVKRYKEEELEEKKKEKDYDSEFMLKQMSGVVTVHGSVEERIRSKINNIQRTKLALDKSFVKR